MLLLASVASAQNQYYISTTGSDSNNGTTPSTPWRTFAQANSAIILGIPGNNCPRSTSANVAACVHVLPGHYVGCINTTKNGVGSGATSVQRITYVSETKYGAVITGCGAGDTWNVSGSDTTVQDFEFDATGTNSCCGIAGYPFGLRVWAIGNKMHDFAGNGNNTGGAVVIMVAPPGGFSYNIMDGNLLYHNNPSSTPNSGGGHGLYSGGAGDIIRNNIVVDQGGGFCITWWHQASNLIIENNTVAQCGYVGIGGGNDGSGASSGPTVYNNSTVNNNISVNNTTGPGIGIAEIGSFTGTNNVYQNNLAYGNTANFQLKHGLTATGTQSGSNSTTFVNYTGTGTGNYQLRAGSTAINNGTTTCTSGVSNCLPTTDFAGIARPQGSAWDIGAYRYAVSATAPSPPTGLMVTIQ
jgi:hypothetical protein